VPVVPERQGGLSHPVSRLYFLQSLTLSPRGWNSPRVFPV
jgi:hypothetical protein